MLLIILEDFKRLNSLLPYKSAAYATKRNFMIEVGSWVGKCAKNHGTIFSIMGVVPAGIKSFCAKKILKSEN